MTYSNGKTAAIKDPGHVANIKAIVGQEQNNYNSFIRANLFKKANMTTQGILFAIKESRW